MIHINFMSEVTPKPNQQYTPEQLMSCQTLVTYEYLVHGLIAAGAIPDKFKAHAGPYLLPLTSDKPFSHTFVDSLGKHYEMGKDGLLHLVCGQMSVPMKTLGNKPDYVPHPKFGKLPTLKTYPAAIGMPKDHMELLRSLESIAQQFESASVTVSTPAGTDNNPTDTWKGPPINPEACAYFSTKTNPEAKLALYLGTQDAEYGMILHGELSKCCDSRLVCPGVSLHIKCNHGDTITVQGRKEESGNYFTPTRYQTASVDIRHGRVMPAELLESVLLKRILTKGVPDEAVREWKPGWVKTIVI